MTTKQVETATVVGTVTGSGNATVTITALGMANTPKAVSVAVTDTDTASIVGGLIRTALAFDTDVAALFLVSGSGANVVLTKHIAVANRAATATSLRVARRLLGAVLADEHYFFYDVPIGGNDTFEADVAWNLINTDLLVVYNTLAALSFNIDYTELT